MHALHLDNVSLSIKDHVATITLNRPQARNALNTGLCQDLHAAIREVRSRDDVHVVLIRANGPVFCAGADLKERKEMNEDQIRARRIKAFAVYAAIEELPMPVVAVIEGPAVGSGCEIASACDFIIASEAASFRYPEARWGTVGATQRLPRIVGRRIAKELMFTGREVTAREAVEIGLVNQVRPVAVFDDFVTELANSIAAAPAAAMRSAKTTIDRGVDDSRYGALAHEILAIEENLAQGTWRAGMSSFS
ncbi:enoyl-CoA hydratase/isomerase family protein [Pseudomonas monteilii]|uniref:Enoyl-CoA hydratase/isomerase family protein n=1 Tax=Pseudomonas monteilii TaxID=76759 RepID=A0A399M015_9PSED|nr:enoyl-CoA hydratase/isomerase family protein [Pseudomonas monteilii]RII74326.1 enoyl-CoA hydratase/isomerase family protein [Pseudomonas monteilii]